MSLYLSWSDYNVSDYSCRSIFHSLLCICYTQSLDLNHMKITYIIHGFSCTITVLCKVRIYIIYGYSSWTMHADTKVVHTILDRKYYRGCKIDWPRSAWLCVRWAFVMDIELELAVQAGRLLALHSMPTCMWLDSLAWPCLHESTLCARKSIALSANPSFCSTKSSCMYCACITLFITSKLAIS